MLQAGAVAGGQARPVRIEPLEEGEEELLGVVTSHIVVGAGVRLDPGPRQMAGWSRSMSSPNEMHFTPCASCGMIFSSCTIGAPEIPQTADELTAFGSTLAQELRAAGVNVNLAPVADTVPPTMTETNAPIGKYRREFGTDPAVVAAAVPPVVSALQNGGVVATVKHFPGLGRITGNTDVTAVGITDSIATALDPHLDPFRAGIAAGVGMVMVSSARYPKLDDANPAMFSRAIVTDLLRTSLGFDGVIVTDDVGAAKAVAAIPVPDRAVRFLAAGGDLVLTASAAQVPSMIAAIKARAANDPTFAADIEQSVRRVLALKTRFGLIRCG